MFGWAFLGCGNIAEQVANELAGEAGQKIVSCWNRSPERAQKFAVKYGARAYRTAEEALNLLAGSNSTRAPPRIPDSTAP